MRLSKKERMKVLAVAPHPDDLEIGCAGTLIKLAKAGHEIHLAILTQGEAGGNAPLRRKEQEAAARLYHCKSIDWLGFEDTKVPLSKESIDAVEAVMQRLQADVVFAPHAEDTHQDHRNTSLQVTSATRYTKNVLFYEVPSSVNFLPDVFVDISSVLKLKYKALKAHKSQVNKVNVAGLSILDCAQATAHFRGYQGRVEAAEGFKSLRLLLEI
jgi:LmbE family N-acetylglucosaminyl deacetylase